MSKYTKKCEDCLCHRAIKDVEMKFFCLKYEYLFLDNVASVCPNFKERDTDE